MPVNEYDDLLGGGASVEANEYDALVLEDARGRESALRRSMYGAASTQPQRRARAIELGQRLRLPPSVVERNMELVERRASVEGVDYGRILERNPGLAKWLENADNAAIGRDDLDALMEIEAKARTVAGDPGRGFFGDLGVAGRTGLSDLESSAWHTGAVFGLADPREAAERAAAANRLSAELRAQQPGYAREFSGAMGAESEEVDAAASEIARGVAQVREGNVLLGLLLFARGSIDTPFQALDMVWEAAKRPRGLAYSTAESGAMSLPSLALGAAGAKVGAVGGGAVGSAAPGIGTATGAAVGGVGGFATGAFAGEAAVEFGAYINQTLRDRGFDVTNAEDLFRAYSDPELMAEVKAEAGRKALATASVSAFFNAFAGAGVARRTASGARRAAGAAGDVGVQMVGEAASEFAGQLAATGEASVGEAVQEGVVSLGQSSVEVVIGASARGGVPLARRASMLAERVREALQTRRSAQALSEAGQAVKASQGVTAVPGKVRELVELAAEGGDTGTVYFQSSDWDAYWQSVGESPSEAAERVLGDGAKSYYEARSTGGDVAVPLGEFLDKLGPTDAYEGLLPLARVKPGGMTLAEADVVLKETPAAVEELAAEAEETSEVAEDKAAQIRQAVAEKLVATGRFDQRTAETNAMLVERFIVTQAQRQGLSPEEMLARFPLEVISEQPQAAERTIQAEPGELEAEESFVPETPLARGRFSRKAVLEYLKGRAEFEMSSLESLDLAVQSHQAQAGEEGSSVQFLEFEGLAVTPEFYRELGKDEKLRLKQRGVLVNEDQAEALRRVAGDRLYDAAVAEAVAGTESRLSGFASDAARSDDAELQLAAWLYENAPRSFRVEEREVGGEKKRVRVSEYEGPPVDVVPANSLFPGDQFTIYGEQAEVTEDGAVVLGKLTLPLGYLEAVPVDRGSLQRSEEGLMFQGGRLAKGTVLYHGTSAPEFDRFLPGVAYLTTDPREAEGFAAGVHLGGGTGGRRRVLSVRVENAGEVVDISEAVDEALMEDGDVDAVIEAEAKKAREAGARFLSFTHPSNVGDGEFTAIVAVNPDTDLKVAGRTLFQSEASDFIERATPKRRAATIEQAREAAAEFVSKPLTNGATGLVATVSNKSLGKMLSNSATEKSASASAHALAVANIDHLFGLAVEGESRPDRAGDPNLRALRRFWAPMIADGRAVAVKLTVKEFVRESEGTRIYTVEAVEVETPASGPQLEAGIEPTASTSRVSEPTSVGLAGVPQSIAEAVAAFNRGDIVEFEQRKRGDKRGAIRFEQTGSGFRSIVDLLEKADLSTFLHESGHFFLEVFGTLAERPDAPDQVKADWQTVLGWLGVKSKAEIETKHHEQWARVVEAYLMKGDAPSSALRQAFARFRAWLVAIYREIRNLNVRLNPEIRAVMDRMLATDEEIAAAESEAQVVQTFLTAEEAGMTPEEFEAYRKAVEDASLKARERLEQKLMAEIRREREKWWKAERLRVRAEVESEVNGRREYRAASILQKGTLPDGSPAPEGLAGLKIDAAALRDYDRAVVRKLPVGVRRREGGVHPDVAAEMLGFGSGEELLFSLATAPRRRDAIEAETDARMRERHGDMLTDGTIADQAMRAVQNEERAKVLHAELQALRRLERQAAPVARQAAREAKARERERGDARVRKIREERRREREEDRAARDRLRGAIPSLEVVRSAARQIVAKKAVRHLSPFQYLVAARRASRAAFEAVQSKDYQEAAIQKQRELLSLELYREATRALEDVGRRVEHLRGLLGDRARARIGKAGHDYLEQIDAILERFEFARVTNRELDRRRSLAEWVKEKEASGETLGEEFEVPEGVLAEAFRVNYREMSYEMLVGVSDLVRQIEHFAGLKNRLLAAKRLRDKDEARRSLISALEQNLESRGQPPLTRHDMTVRERLTRRAQELDASLLKVEQLIDWMDGGDVDGPWNELLWNGAAAAQAAEYDYTARVTARVAEAVAAMPREIRRRLGDRVQVPGLDRPISRKTAIGVALNVGNESNYNKMAKGHGWTDGQIRAITDVLTKEEWDYVQSVWDLLESIRPDIWALEKELKGIEPELVEARPVETRFGSYRGGYYPVMYDPTGSEQGQLQMSDRVGSIVEKGYVRATTPRGHTKSRVEGFAAPFDFDVDNLPGHLAGVIKDLTHRKWLIDANWIVNDREVRKAIRRRLGDPYVDLLSDWVRRVVNDRNHASVRSLKLWHRLFEQARYNVLIAGMGFKAATLMAQIAGVGPAIEVVGGARVFLRGVAEVLRKPLACYEFVTGKSGEMRHRFQTRDRDLRAKLLSLQGRADVLAKVQEFSLYGIAFGDMMVAMPTWMAAYRRGVEEGLSDESAVNAADRAVRLSQGAGGAKDLASVAARNDQLMRLLTMFYTPFSALYARLRDVGHQAGRASPSDVPRLAARLFWVWLFAATVAELAAGRGPDEDDEEGWLGWWVRTVGVYPFMAVPGLRDLASATVSDYGYQFSPVEQAGKAVASAAREVGRVAAGEKEMQELADDALRVFKYLAGLPTGQLEITGGYLLDLSAGEEDPENLAEFARGLLFRRRD